MSIIFDEEKYVEEIIKHKMVIQRKQYTLQLLASYYWRQGYDKKVIEELLHNFAKKNFSDYNRVKLYKTIDKAVSVGKKYVLKVSTPIKITETEINTIMKENNLKTQKLMFVYLCLAKYYMSNRHSDKYYVGASDTDIYKLCNMYVKKQDKLDLMHYLTKNGYITPNLNMSVVVNFINEDSPTVIELIPNDTMVYRFEKYLGGIFHNCAICGNLYKKTNNNMKYCRVCGEKVKNKII